jgi:hypothetical protein
VPTPRRELPYDIAWIDSLTIARGTSSGSEALLEIGFDACQGLSPSLGGLLVATPPQRLQRR